MAETTTNGSAPINSHTLDSDRMLMKLEQQNESLKLILETMRLLLPSESRSQLTSRPALPYSSRQNIYTQFLTHRKERLKTPLCDLDSCLERVLSKSQSILTSKTAFLGPDQLFNYTDLLKESDRNFDDPAETATVHFVDRRGYLYADYEGHNAPVHFMNPSNHPQCLRQFARHVLSPLVLSGESVDAGCHGCPWGLVITAFVPKLPLRSVIAEATYARKEWHCRQEASNQLSEVRAWPRISLELDFLTLGKPQTTFP